MRSAGVARGFYRDGVGLAVKNQLEFDFLGSTVGLKALADGLVGAREDWVYCELKSRVYKVWNNPGKQGTVCFEAGIGVDFDKVDFEVGVKHEVVA